MLLKGKVAVITGGNRGIGRACVEALAREGARVVIACRNMDSAREVIEANPGLLISAQEMDVSTATDVISAMEAIIGNFECIDILVNNAGVSKDNLAMRMSEDEWDTVLDTNLKGAFFCSQAALKTLRRQGGTIINISSVIAQHGNPGQANYAASKAGIEGLTRCLARETGGKVRVNAVAPGWINTDMTKDIPSNIREQALAHVALKRAGTPEEVAAVVLFLVTHGTYINGAIIPVDGGMA